MTLPELANELDLTKQAVSYYEKGTRQPGIDSLVKLQHLFGVPRDFFFTDQPTTGTSEKILYRSLKSTTKKSRTYLQRKLDWFQIMAEFLQEQIVFPEVKIPNDPIDPTSSDFARIDRIALKYRKSWGLGTGPIKNMVALLENLGVVVGRANFDKASKVDGFSLWNPLDLRPYVLLNDFKLVGPRSRFDAAHELGHLILHQELAREECFTVSPSYTNIENQAHRFASSFLLPPEALQREMTYPSLATFIGLKNKWKVSVKMIMKKCRDLNLITADHYRNLSIHYSRKKWNSGEPLDDTIPVERPQFLRRSVELLLTEGVLSPEELRYTFPYPVADIEELLGLDNGFLERDRSVQPTLKTPLNNVIPFKNGRNEPWKK